MSYFVISRVHGEMWIEELTHSDVLEALEIGPDCSTDVVGIDGSEAVSAIPKGCIGKWCHTKVLIIKGEIVVPQPLRGWTIE